MVHTKEKNQKRVAGGGGGWYTVLERRVQASQTKTTTSEFRVGKHLPLNTFKHLTIFPPSYPKVKNKAL